MNIPPFSLFSAISELFVTTGVIYVLRRNWTRRSFPLAAFVGVALFEAFVNVMYMATKAAKLSGPGAEVISPTMRLIYAGHGMLSLLAYLVFVILGVMAYQDQRQGRYFFPERPLVTWSFAVLWGVSIISGEALFVKRYLL
ncbi:MAG TPA: hypothetical protein VGK93_02260 [Candidatus Eisenbacteria bacterium]|jgi:hypothetical protein